MVQVVFVSTRSGLADVNVTPDKDSVKTQENWIDVMVCRIVSHTLLSGFLYETYIGISSYRILDVV